MLTRDGAFLGRAVQSGRYPRVHHDEHSSDLPDTGDSDEAHSLHGKEVAWTLRSALTVLGRRCERWMPSGQEDLGDDVLRAPHVGSPERVGQRVGAVLAKQIIDAK
jgi:hypothetical protein